jgi:hypothetical protein
MYIPAVVPDNEVKISGFIGMFEQTYWNELIRGIAQIAVFEGSLTGKRGLADNKVMLKW